MQPSRNRAIGNAGGSTHRALPATSRFPANPSTVPAAGRTVVTPTTPAGPTPGLTFQIGEPVMLTNWVHDEYPKGTIVVIRGVERQAQSASTEPAPWHMSDNDSVYRFSRRVPRPDFKVYGSHTSDGAPLHTQVSTTLGGIPSVEQHAEGDFIYTLCHFNFTPLGGPRRNSELEVPTGTQCRVHALTTRTGTKYARKINDPHWVQKSRYVLQAVWRSWHWADSAICSAKKEVSNFRRLEPQELQTYRQAMLPRARFISYHEMTADEYTSIQLSAPQ